MAYKNVAETFLASVTAYPDKPALIFKDVSLTYAELNTKVNRIAAVLTQDFGVRSGDKIAFLLPNSTTIIEVYYAVQKIGAVAVPLNFRYNAQEIRYLLESSDALLLIFSGCFEDKVAECKARLSSEVHMITVGEKLAWAPSLEAACLEKSGAEPEWLYDGEALARIQFTGGSTGAPKGAARTHHADLVEFAAILDSNGLDKDPDNVVLIQCPLEHHGGHSWFTTALAAGTTVIICDSFDPENILKTIENHKVSYMILLPPSTYLRLFACPTIGDYDLSSVRLAQSSAGGTTKEIIEEIYRHFPNALVNYGWGQSESGLGITLAITKELLAEDSPLLSSIGRPMKFAEAKIVDENDDPLPDGEVGEALIRSEASMQGYYKQDELTQTMFTSDGWLRTGDLMVRDEQGYYYLKARKKEMIKSGGENVFASDVERALCLHPAVRDCVVFGTEDAVLGEAVAAVVELEKGASLTTEELQSHCKQQIASYKKPRYVLFVESLGRSDAGKINKQKLLDEFNLQKPKLLS
jgi:acyl-CoA synthetase (AMP-forming)/AMP-acid ligase II